VAALVELSWQAGGEISAGLAALKVALTPVRDRRVAGARGVARELSLVCGLYAVWRLAGTLSVMKVTHALARGRALWRLERFLHLPSELALQRGALGHPIWVELCNRYYQLAHGPALMACLAWLFFRHRERYPRARNVIAAVTGAALAIQLIPVAPPRLLTGLGFVDTGLLYHQSVYTALGQGMADQLSAMPSVHVAWAVMIAVFVVEASSSRWRFLVIAHPVLTVWAVVVTANHFWLDGVVGAVLIVPALIAQDGVERWRARSGRQVLDGAGRATDEQPRRDSTLLGASRRTGYESPDVPETAQPLSCSPMQLSGRGTPRPSWHR